MGWTRSALIFCKHTALIASCIRDWGGVPGAHPTVQYVDDLFRRMAAIDRGPEMGLTNRVLRQCNVARATEKEAEPNGSIEGLGRHASSALQRVGPSLKAVFNAFTELLVPLDLAAEIGGRPYWMPRERMAKLAGRLGWVAESTYGGKLRTGAFWWAAAEAERHGHAHVNIRSPGLLQAASWWTDAASGGRLRGDVFVPRNDLLVSVGEVSLGGKSAGAMLEDLHLAGATVPSEGTICSRGDASGKSNAWAAILGSCALHGVFSGDQLSWGIDAKEMWVIRCLMKAFPELQAEWWRSAWITPATNLPSTRGRPPAQNASGY